MISGYRVAGTTDDVTICDQCGREDLRMTVRLVVIVNDTEDGEMYVGSECATAFPPPGTSKRRTRRQVLAEASAADRERDGWRQKAREMLAFYDAPGLTPREQAKLYIRHSGARVADIITVRRQTDPEFTSQRLVAERIAEWREMLVTGQAQRG